MNQKNLLLLLTLGLSIAYVVISNGQSITDLNNPRVASINIIDSVDTLDEIFFGIKPNIENVDQNKLITLIATGDVMTARYVNVLSEQKNDYTWMFQNIKDLLSTADITFANFENPIKQNCPLKSGGMIFCARIKNIEGLKFAGIDIVSLSNNHALDQRIDGLIESEKILNDADIKTVGVKNPVYIDVKGIKIAFLAYSELSCIDKYLGCIKNKSKIITDIKDARQNADIVIPMFHWGAEYTTKITTLQKEVAHLAIDNGADLVLGNHPHWVQPIEAYKNKIIIYSHGNLVFDQMWSQKTREGLVTKFYFYENKLIYMELMPILIEDYGRPKILTGSQKARQIQYMIDISTNL